MKDNFFKNNKLLSRLFLVSVLINVVVCGYVLTKYFSKREKTIVTVGGFGDPSKLEKYFNSRNQLFEKLSNDTSDIVFVGNSITENFPLQEMFQNLKIKNRGVRGNQTFDVIARIDKIAATNPDKLFLQIGINDFITGLSVDSAFSNFKKIIIRIKELSPDSKIYVQSVFPTSLQYKEHILNIETYNEKLNSYCSDIGASYINLYPHFLLSGELNGDYTYDGLHLNGNGYLRWKELIEKYVNE